LELEENELDPQSSVPTFMTISARDTDETLKTMTKTGGLMCYDVQPYTLEELTALCRLIYQLDREALLTNFLLSINEETTEADALAIFHQRFEKVGPLPRIVFTDTVSYSSYLREMQKGLKKVYNHHGELNELGFQKFSSCLKYYLVPVPVSTDHIFNDPLTQHIVPGFNLISNYAAELLANQTTLLTQVTSLGVFGLDMQIMEALALHKIRGYPVPDRFQHWEWHVDPGYDHSLTVETLLPTVDIPEIPVCSELCGYDTDSPIDVNKLKLGVVYKPNTAAVDGLLRNGVFYLTQNHNNKKTKTKKRQASEPLLYLNYLYTISHNIPHPIFSRSMVVHLMENLEFLRDNENVHINLIGLMDWSKSNPRGCILADQSGELDDMKRLGGIYEGKNGEGMATINNGRHSNQARSLATRDRLQDFAPFHRINSYIVRTAAFPIIDKNDWNEDADE
jgi:hypothetical protein